MSVKIARWQENSKTGLRLHLVLDFSPWEQVLPQVTKVYHKTLYGLKVERNIKLKIYLFSFEKR